MNKTKFSFRRRFCWPLRLNQPITSLEEIITNTAVNRSVSPWTKHVLMLCSGGSGLNQVGVCPTCSVFFFTQKNPQKQWCSAPPWPAAPWGLTANEAKDFSDGQPTHCSSTRHTTSLSPAQSSMSSSKGHLRFTFSPHSFSSGRNIRSKRRIVQSVSLQWGRNSPLNILTFCFIDFYF